MLYNVTKMSYYIYKICCDDLPNYNYIGSTKAFRRRKNHHKQDCYNENSKTYNRKLYNTIRENGGWDNWRMVILEDLGEISFTEARIKEEEHRVKLNANLNMNKCYRTEEEFLKYKKEYHENNKEHKKEYYEKNKEQNKEQNKEYYQKNKEEILKHVKEYQQQNKEQLVEKNKIYYQNNKEQMLEKQKVYREKNKEAIKEKSKEKVTCDCGCITRKTDLAKHKKTNKHLKLMKHLEKI